MFKKLKLKFILTNIITSTAVLMIAFSSIYLVAKNTNDKREYKPVFESTDQMSTQMTEQFNEQIKHRMDEQIRAEREASLQTLLISLIVSGIAVEAIIALLSIYLAEQSVKPVRDAYQAQKDFIANASHEIKTPLAVIQANLEAADIKNNKWLDNVSKKAEDLTELNNQLLALARSESLDEEIRESEVNLKKLVMNSIDAFEPKAEEQGKTITFSFCIPDDYKVKLNRKAFEQILNIYIDNGIKYAKNTIGINIKKNRITVISDGKPIPEAKLPHLFDRFYQADKTSEGVGLGLAIAKSVAEKNDWKVYAEVEKELKTNLFILEFK
ncbi:HAMP domain-containing histidine kinase [Candidatus Saccharibacteria bacterium]|nr:HAMP domain-containing histidine kinase [Candidatus Saccharibacteria bacterium]MBR0416077.1 HAMP domain-containing histidine kinase [Candidatus Saccharibacteria bacterium]